jgi:PKD repeat protein
MNGWRGHGRWATLIAACAALACGLAGPALADHPQPPPDISKLEYAPVGHFKPGDPLPAANDADAVTSLMDGKLFNPSGSYNAFDTNVFEVLALPYRAAGDPSGGDAYGNGGDAEHGRCGPDSGADARPRKGDFAETAGACPNHQLEYVEHYEARMRDILGDFGMTFHRYEFENPGSSNTQAGRAINPAAVVPGADHPEDTVIIGAHFDQTDDGPASAWDSQEGHAQVIRVAKLMADYWRRTGTRPSATVKFIPWDGEESGTLGSQDYAENNVVPGQEDRVRGYWNTDPCSGGYPAYRYGNPADRVDLGIQLANPRPSDDPATLSDTAPPASAAPRMNEFNANARRWTEEVFDHLDDSLTLAPGVQKEIFVSTAEGGPTGGDIAPEGDRSGRYDVVLGNGRAIAFSSDWANFERLGIPFYNPGPEITGPSSQLEPGNPDALVILHSPLDNMKTLNAYSGGAKDGESFSEGWIKGMEMCSHLLAWGMLQPEQAGASKPSAGELVAYYEALPNEASRGKPVTFDASGSHVIAEKSQSGKDKLEYRWDFGDGTTGAGRVASHVYEESGVYQSRLTVRRGKRSDTMNVPITVLRGVAGPGPLLAALPATDPDGNIALSWTWDDPRTTGYAVEEGTGVSAVMSDGAENLGAWTTETTNTKLQPWQPASSAPAVQGPKRRSGSDSLWTGIAAQDQRLVIGREGGGTSSLTSKDGIALPAGRSSILTYWADLSSDANDYVRVEVAQAEAGHDEHWETVEYWGGDAFARGWPDAGGYTTTHPVNRTSTRFLKHTVDLSDYAGKTVRLRFSYVLGPAFYVNVWRPGVYIDDISVEAADFSQIATTPTDLKTYEATGRANGTYLYRVRALFGDAPTSDPGNVERTTVAR